MTNYDDDPEFAKAVQAIASNLDIGLHEAVHAVIWRARGQDIGEIVNEDDRVVTVISPQRSLDEDDIFAVMAPEVFMEINGVQFTDKSVSSDRQAVDTLLDNWAIIEGKSIDKEQTKEQLRRELVPVLRCPHVVNAIKALAVVLDDIETVGSITGNRIHEIIDPILVNSYYGDGLRERLKGEER